jgi:hypothetical protein
MLYAILMSPVRATCPRMGNPITSIGRVLRVAYPAFHQVVGWSEEKGSLDQEEAQFLGVGVHYKRWTTLSSG